MLLVGSANVYTALLPWMVLLTEAGATVRVKPARGQEAAVRAMAAATDPTGSRLTIRAWKGGEDEDAEGAAFEGVDAVIAFGGAEALSALQARAGDGVLFFGFGPRFGVSVVRDVLRSEGTVDNLVRDAMLYDGRGCMSPAAVFTASPPGATVDVLAATIAETPWLTAPYAHSPVEAAETRARMLLARALGGEARAVSTTYGLVGTVLYLPSGFDPVALPRVLVVHPMSEIAAVKPWFALLGTVAGDERGDLPALRRCAVGEMQAPVHDGSHEGIGVIGQIARLRRRPDQ